MFGRINKSYGVDDVNFSTRFILTASLAARAYAYLTWKFNFGPNSDELSSSMRQSFFSSHTTSTVSLNGLSALWSTCRQKQKFCWNIYWVYRRWWKFCEIFVCLFVSYSFLFDVNKLDELFNIQIEQKLTKKLCYLFRENNSRNRKRSNRSYFLAFSFCRMGQVKKWHLRLRFKSKLKQV